MPAFLHGNGETPLAPDASPELRRFGPRLREFRIKAISCTGGENYLTRFETDRAPILTPPARSREPQRAFNSAVPKVAMNARILTSLLVLGCSTLLLTNCSSSDTPSNTPTGGSNSGVAGSAAGTPGAAGGSAPTAGGSAPVASGGSAGSAGTAVAGGSGGSGSGVAGSGGSGVGGSTSQGGIGGASAGAGGKATGGGSSGGAVGTGGGASFALTSDKLTAGVKMPSEFTCAMNSHPNPPSPPFAWTPGPSGTMSYALIMFDPDASTAGFTHWIVWDIPASTTMLPAALGGMATLTMPAGAKQVAGSGMGYLGPCPPGNATHNYKFTLYALDVATLPGVMTSSSTANLTTAIQMHDIASAVMIVPSDGK